MEEIWRTAQYINPDGSIEIYEGYEVSNLGRVKSLNYRHTGKEKVKKPGSCSKYGHQMICVCKNSKMYFRSIHRLILSTFNPEGYFEKAVVDHIDSNPENNRLENLHWITQKENSNTDHAKQAFSKARKGKYTGADNSVARPCEYDGKSFVSITEAYKYAQEHGYTYCYNVFWKMIKKGEN